MRKVLGPVRVVGPSCPSLIFSRSLSRSFFRQGYGVGGEIPLHRARQRPRLLWGEEVTLRPSADAALFANHHPQQLELVPEKSTEAVTFKIRQNARELSLSLALSLSLSLWLFLLLVRDMGQAKRAGQAQTCLTSRRRRGLGLALPMSLCLPGPHGWTLAGKATTTRGATLCSSFAMLRRKVVEVTDSEHSVTTCGSSLQEVLSEPARAATKRQHLLGIQKHTGPGRTHPAGRPWTQCFEAPTRKNHGAVGRGVPPVHAWDP